MFMDYHFLFEIAVILLSTKVLGILTKRFALPQVVGALLAGLLLGPAMLGVLQETTLMDQLAELGVIVLMFNAGLETDLGELKRSGKAAFVIATTILTPVLLKLVYRGKEHDYSDLQESELVNAYEDAAAFDLASQALLEDHENLKQSARKK